MLIDKSEINVVPATFKLLRFEWKKYCKKKNISMLVKFYSNVYWILILHFSREFYQFSTLIRNFYAVALFFTDKVQKSYTAEVLRAKAVGRTSSRLGADGGRGGHLYKLLHGWKVCYWMRAIIPKTWPQYSTCDNLDPVSSHR